jgi:predicted dehydrogenase
VLGFFVEIHPDRFETQHSMSDHYDLKSGTAARIDAPDFPYQPPVPNDPVPKIGMIGCGGITEHHLKGYRAAGWAVDAFFDANPQAAENRRREFYPQARVCSSVDELLEDGEITVVDIATHPKVRAELIEKAIAAGKHVLSQKPFATDLATGERLVGLAKDAGVLVAVNQNGRWAPYFSYMRHAVCSGLVGEVGSVHMVLNWDHTWTAGTPFEQIHHLMLYDFGIHWMDAARSFFGGAAATSVSATIDCFPDQPIKPPLLANVVIRFPQGMATLAFNGCSRFGARETCTITGSKGTLHAVGDLCAISSVEVVTAEGIAVAELAGSWFPDGFRGCMAELLCAIGEKREPENSATDNLKTLAIVFAAMKSADEGRPVPLA